MYQSRSYVEWFDRAIAFLLIAFCTVIPSLISCSKGGEIEIWEVIGRTSRLNKFELLLEAPKYVVRAYEEKYPECPKGYQWIEAIMLPAGKKVRALVYKEPFLTSEDVFSISFEKGKTSLEGGRKVDCYRLRFQCHVDPAKRAMTECKDRSVYLRSERKCYYTGCVYDEFGNEFCIIGLSEEPFRIFWNLISTSKRK